MSWIDQVQNGLIITMGDGKSYQPNWMNAQKSIEYNVSEFDFPNINGTLVSRKSSRGRRYNIEIVIQGENHLETSLAFESSANDPRAWVISHPLYGRIVVQPISLTFDNSLFNVSKITGSVVETLSEDFPKGSINAIDKLATDKEVLDDSFEQAFDVTPKVSDINLMTDNVSLFYNEGTKIVNDNTNAEDYFNLFNSANAKILNATSEPLEAIRSVQNMINAPFSFKISVTNRINSFINQFNSLSSSVSSLLSKNEKKIYENNAGMVVSDIALSAVNPEEGDYENREDVLIVITKILDTYDLYIADLDSLQSDNGGSPDSYVPDYVSMIALNELILFAISNLFDIAISSKQERIVILEKDSNVILLAHRFYGLQADDTSIDYLISTNKIGLNEILSLRKGREIKYYI